MKNKLETDPRQQTQSPLDDSGATGNAPTSILSHLPADVKILSDFIQRRHIPLMDMVEVVKTLYPRCDKSLISKCAHGHETGAMLRRDAMMALQVRFAEDGQKPPRKPRRKKPNRLTCRIGDALFAALQRRVQATGQTVQDYLEALILKDLTGGAS